MFNSKMPRSLTLQLALLPFISLGIALAEEFGGQLETLFEKHCYECHDDISEKGGLDLFSLPQDLSDEATFAKWERIFDRVADGEMPPEEEEPLSGGEKRIFGEILSGPLATAHAATKGTVLRRLNRHEYENTLNDLLGIRIEAAELLPEDGRSGEFDTVGEALGLSMIQLQSYLDVAKLALDTGIADTVLKPEPSTVTANYADTRGAEKFIGTSWHKLPDGSVVFYQALHYPTGMLREANAPVDGYYKVRITGYAHQSDKPVTFSVGSTSFERASKRPTWGYWSFAPGEPQTVEFTTWMEDKHMIEITPQGIYDKDYLIKKDGIAAYQGPGLAISSVELIGPIVDEFPTKGHRLIFDGIDRREIEPSDPKTKAKSYYKPKFEIVTETLTEDVIAILTRFGTTAFRRPVDEQIIAPYVILFQKEISEGADVEDALKTALAGMLCSTDFLYFNEPVGKLDNFALASRLSYFLTRSLPDETLLSAAAASNFNNDSDAIRAGAIRLIGSPHFERFIDDFTDSWLDLRDIEFTMPDSKLFPEFDQYLLHSMVDETRAFFRELIDSNLGVDNLAKSDWTMLNWRLADHYGIDGVTSPTLEKVSLPANSPRGGLLSQASIHKVSANGTNTSPVLRGVWINERILGKYPAHPPPGTPGVEPDIRGAETLREILEKHRDSESCQACHQLIDPPGFALESFNPVGGWRENFRSGDGGEKPTEQWALGKKIRYKIGLPVDASGELQDGRSFSGFMEYRDLIASDPDQLAKSLVTKLLTFGTGREMGFSDRSEIDQIVAESAKNGHGVRDLVLSVVTSDIFRHK